VNTTKKTVAGLDTPSVKEKYIMNKSEINTRIHVLPSYVEDEVIDETIAISERQAWHAGNVGSDGFGRYDPEIRSVDLMNIDTYYHPRLYNIMKHTIEVFNVSTNRNYSITGINQMDLLHYKEGGQYNFHRDTTQGMTHHERKISCIVQLSNPEDYEGGDFVLDAEEVSIDEKELRRKRGTVILFESRLDHRILPITKGERYSLIGWGVGRV
jgi:predicted 2-oxoglutarate/Fe(II)-dependent dioxygenase YbiX